jgi:hypothetical protein
VKIVGQGFKSTAGLNIAAEVPLPNIRGNHHDGIDLICAKTRINIVYILTI